jgi:hypothetical protein
MKTAAQAARLSLLAVLACSILATSAARTSAATSAGEPRVRAVVGAFSAGDPQGLERAARENYSAAALARRTPEQRAQALKRVFGETGALEITEMKTEGDTIVAAAKAARGGLAVFTFTLGAKPEQRIENVSVQMQRGSGPQLTEDPYKPYAFPIGEWESTGGIRQSLRWGSQKTYIWYSVFMREEGSAQERRRRHDDVQRPRQGARFPSCTRALSQEQGGASRRTGPSFAR